jgi:hypothetical protein
MSGKSMYGMKWTNKLVKLQEQTSLNPELKG